MRSRSSTSWALLSTATPGRVSHLQPQDSLSLGARSVRRDLLPVLVRGNEDGQGNNRDPVVMRHPEVRTERAMTLLASIEAPAVTTGVGRWLANAIAVVGAAACAVAVAFVVDSV